MTTTLTQVDPPPSPTLGGVAVLVVPALGPVGAFLRVAVEAAAAVERTAAAAGLTVGDLERIRPRPRQSTAAARVRVRVHRRRPPLARRTRVDARRARLPGRARGRMHGV
jgi:hypothetical protein